jgi:hypothetical protein
MFVILVTRELPTLQSNAAEETAGGRPAFNVITIVAQPHVAVAPLPHAGQPFQQPQSGVS